MPDSAFPARPAATGHRRRRPPIDAFTLHAASALAAVTFLRSCAGFGFPPFAPTMYKALGYGKGDTILACAAIVIGCPA